MKKRAVSEQTLSEIIGILMNSTVNATTSQVLKLVKDVEESEQIQDEPKEVSGEMGINKPPMRHAGYQPDDDMVVKQGPPPNKGRK